MTTLPPGANTGVASGTLSVTVSYTPVTGADLDVSAFLLNESRKVRGDNDMCFFGQQSVNNGAVKLVESAAGARWTGITGRARDSLPVWRLTRMRYRRGRDPGWVVRWTPQRLAMKR